MDSFSGLLEQLNGTLTDWVDGAVAFAPRLAIALLLGVAFFGLAKLVRGSVVKGLERMSVAKSVNILLSRIAQFAVLLGGLMVMLEVLKLEDAVTSVVAGAGVVGLAVGFAFQDLAANLISGVGMSMRRPFKEGDVIETNDILGVAEHIELRTTVIRTFDGKRILVPNKSIYQSVLVNHSASDLRRVDVACGVAYDSDLPRVKEVAVAALRDVPRRAEDREPEIMFKSFGGSSIDFQARVWIPFHRNRDYVEATDEIVLRLKKAFDEADIEIPFPIRTLELGDSARATVHRLQEAA